jgi:PepSY-associated TM region
MVERRAVLRGAVVIHRWLGIVLGPLFAMWFASGIVMHFAPFPQLDESERVAGLPLLKLAGPLRPPADAMNAVGAADTLRIRLIQRADGPVYIVSGLWGSTALRASDLASAGVTSSPLALVIGADHARQRGLKAADAAKISLLDYDQWTVAGKYRRHRPLYRLALDDDAGTEIYISSKTGEIVLDTTRWERAWNFVGSVAHWIYVPQLRNKPELWSAVVWWLSLAALVSVLAGAVIGVARLRFGDKRRVSPYWGMHWWHHVTGLASLIFVTTWIFSGWLSMDDGWLFSRARASSADIAAIAGKPPWDLLSLEELRRIDPSAREVEWFAFAGKLFRREITAPGAQQLSAIGDGDAAQKFLFLPLTTIGAIATSLGQGLGQGCSDPAAVDATDNYAISSVMPNTPVERIACGDVWYDIDAANGALAQKTDSSRRAYRWLYGALHRLDFPALAARPMLRTVVIVPLCTIGFLFSLTGIVIGWRRLRRS